MTNATIIFAPAPSRDEVDRRDETIPMPEARRPEPLVISATDLLLPEGQRFVTSPEMFPLDKFGLPKPRYSVQEAAKFFFASGADWLRWRMRPSPDKGHPDGYFILDGQPVLSARTEANARYFTLYDIERMAHALAQNNIIDGASLSQTIRLVKISAQMYGLVP